MTSQVTLSMSRTLKKAAGSNGAPIWSRLARESLKPSISRRVINLNKMDSLTKSGDVVFFAGKVLGTGRMTHGITLCSFSISRAAARKVLSAGGSVLGHDEMIKRYPSGSKVVLLG